jgi:hypothetical protein
MCRARSRCWGIRVDEHEAGQRVRVPSHRGKAYAARSNATVAAPVHHRPPHPTDDTRRWISAAARTAPRAANAAAASSASGNPSVSAADAHVHGYEVAVASNPNSHVSDRVDPRCVMQSRIHPEP